MRAKGNAKKTWAAALAGVLAVAIVLTGTLAWRNMTQKTANEFFQETNPGGRMHDDFNGEENKDIYAENFTDKEGGTPVYVRVRLLEYMETGADAGINRTVVNDDGVTVPNPSRNVKPLVVGADINNVDTWYLHKPLGEGETDPFHTYWEWATGGQTTYMPTFNKNKDSISVDVNGTYVGTDKDFQTGAPYDDYKTYTDGQESDELNAYYDADENSDDEYVEGVSPAPGAGGDRKGASGVTHPNYEVKKEKHTAQKTLNGLGVITMAEWIEAEMPVCNKWVWDEDGWFYWPEPVMPQTATGLLLDKVTQIKNSSDKCYYAIELEGQFIDSLEADGLGLPEVKVGESVTQEATGFYVDGVTDNAIALLTQAANVEVGPDNKWYLSLGQNLYKEITDDEGTLGDLICAFEDTNIGTTDDLDHTHIAYEATAVEVNGTNYGNYFLLPTDTEDYYRAVGDDGLLGTGDDDRLWVTAGNTFPNGLMDEVVDAVTVNIPTGTTELTEGDSKYIEMEVGTTLANGFTADVKLDGADASNTDVTWSVKAADGKRLAAGTTIDATTGILAVDEHETPRFLTVTATSKLDNRQVGRYSVKVYGKPNVAVKATGSVTEIKAGSKLIFIATVKRGDEAMDPQPTVEWSKGTVTPPSTTRTVPDTSAITVDSATGELYVGRAVPAGTTVEVVATYHKDASDTTGLSGSKTVTVTDADAVTITLSSSADSVEPGDTTGVTFTATLSDLDNLAQADVDWEVGTSDDNGANITTISGLTITNSLDSATNVNSGKLVLPADFSITDNGTTLWVKATAKDGSANSAWKATSIGVVEPTKITTIVRTDGRELKVINNGQPTALKATVMKSETEEYKGNAVTWWAGDSSGTAIDGVKIDENTGAITVTTTVADGTQITVKATSKVKGDLVSQATVTVWDGIIIIDGTEVTYDSQTYIVLTRDTANNRMLILRKDCLDTKSKFNDDNTSSTKTYWRDSKIRTYLNGDWIDNQRELTAALADPTGTPIKTRATYNDSTSHYITNDKVFLLSMADIYSLSGNAPCNDDDYTVNGKFKWSRRDYDASYDKWAAKVGGSASEWWTRSQCDSSTVCVVRGSGYRDNKGPTYEYGIRPACWVKITP